MPLKLRPIKIRAKCLWFQFPTYITMPTMSLKERIGTRVGTFDSQAACSAEFPKIKGNIYRSFKFF